MVGSLDIASIPFLIEGRLGVAVLCVSLQMCTEMIDRRASARMALKRHRLLRQLIILVDQVYSGQVIWGYCGVNIYGFGNRNEGY